MKIYHYNCDGFDDTGFGCVYRNAQTCLHATGALSKVPTVQSLIVYFHGPRALDRYTTLSPVTLWIEPYDVYLYLKSTTNNTPLPQNLCYSPTAEMVYTACHRTPRFVYDSSNTLFVFEKYLEICQRHLSRRPGVPILIDNGVYSFCIESIANDKSSLVVIDPHVRSADQARRKLVDLAYLRSNVWYTLLFF